MMEMMMPEKFTTLQQIKKLDEERAKLLESAKSDALARAKEAINELTALGFDYELVEPAKETARKTRTVRKRMVPDHHPKGTYATVRSSEASPRHSFATHLLEEPGFEPRLTESESAPSRKYRGSKERVARFQVHGLDPPISVEPHPLGPPHRPRPARRNECERARL